MINEMVIICSVIKGKNIIDKACVIIQFLFRTQVVLFWQVLNLLLNDSQ